MSLAVRSRRWVPFFPGKSPAQWAAPHLEHVQNEPELFLQPIRKVSYFPAKTNKSSAQTQKRCSAARWWRQTITSVWTLVWQTKGLQLVKRFQVFRDVFTALHLGSKGCPLSPPPQQQRSKIKPKWQEWLLTTKYSSCFKHHTSKESFSDTKLTAVTVS